ncbi:sirtuin [Neolentinus lepideus HHB14362 ss-1]|uniref:Sirtuin n=1 Tax=Neolentinus lepideus HHB14362 ss-1 TaxID=1314782 RepID=A0A165SLS7_9AGAM|nr:sirtuin [Neolentinus lepideus HHB14362 ss-1]
MSPSSDAQAFRDAFANSKRVVILAGAGLSAASGIPTFRGPNGLWKTKSSKLFATPEGFKEDPSGVWQFYHYKREGCLSAQPNAAHRAIASFAVPAVRSRLMPSLQEDKLPLFVTQNFDGLSLRALDELSDQLTPAEIKLARERVIETHGSAFKTICLQCKHINHTFDSPLSPALAGITEQNAGERDIPIDQLPRCGGPDWKGSNRWGRCGGLLRPAVVWFGEVPEGMGEIAKELNWTDLLIVVGTSSLVHPAAGFAKTIKSRGGKVAIVNLERSEGDSDADFLFIGPCEETLPLLLK